MLERAREAEDVVCTGLLQYINSFGNQKSRPSRFTVANNTNTGYFGRGHLYTV